MTVLTLPEAKAHLNITSNTQDAELGSFIESAESAIADRVGPLAPTGVTVRVEGGRRALVLPTARSVISLTSVTPVGSVALVLEDLHLNARAGVIEYADGSAFSARAYDVVFQAGYDALPGALRMAVLEMVRHLWDTQRGGGSARIGSPQFEGTANTIPGAAYLLPFRVSELIAPYRRTGVA